MVMVSESLNNSQPILTLVHRLHLDLYIHLYTDSYAFPLRNKLSAEDGSFSVVLYFFR